MKYSIFVIETSKPLKKFQINMKFDPEIKQTEKIIQLKDYFSMKCPFCDSKNIKIRSSRTRIIQDLGSPFEKVIIKLKVAYVSCSDCKAKFTPEHPFFPPKLEYSRAIVDYALMRYHYENTSGKQISLSLRRVHNVDVPEATVYTWLKEYSPEFLKARIQSNNSEVSQIKTINVDGTFVSMGKDIIGKKRMWNPYR